MNSSILQVQGVNFSYDQSTVLHSISMNVSPGEFIGVIGPNGSGKSTLLKLLGGVLKPDSGQLHFKETNYLDYKQKQLAQSITWVPQEHPMAFNFKVSEIVLMGRHPYLSAFTFEGEDDMEIAHSAMESTQTLQFAQRNFNDN